MTENYIEMLENPQATVRYEACEALRVASSLNDAEIHALENALSDPDPTVVEAADRALRTHNITPTDSATSVDDVISPGATPPKNSSYWNSMGCFFSTPIYLVLFAFLLWKHFRITGDIFPGRGGPSYDGEETFCFSALLPTIIIAVLLYLSANALYETKSARMRKIFHDNPNSILSLSIFIVFLLIPLILFWFALEWFFDLIVGPIQYPPFAVKELIAQNAIFIIGFVIFLILSSLSSRRRKRAQGNSSKSTGA